ncbi:MAG: hypothetical protein MK085_01305 [Phycisphaerales bacterium]|nr:hypothetical protein [Phycisphaerales bacterium]
MGETDLKAWEWLATEESEPLLTAVSEGPEEWVPAAIARLREQFPGQPVAEAIQLVQARDRARVKFPGADRLWCDRQGVEQASSRLVADYKARRFGDLPVLDLCCGIGGDAMSLARRGATTGVDLDPVRAWMCGRNAGIDVRSEDIRDTDLDHPLLHIDPARRDEGTGRRLWRPEQVVPDLESITALLVRCEGGGLKLGPGLPRPFVLPWPEGHQEMPVTLEFIAEGRNLVQAVAWTGSLATEGVACRATDVVEGGMVEGVPGSPPPGDGQLRRHLLVPHPVIERAQLLNTVRGVDAVEPARGLGLLTADEPLDSPWFDVYEVLDVLPPRLSKVSSWLAARGAGPVVVRTRDGAVDADDWTRRLQGDGDLACTVFGLRVGRKVVVVMARSIDESHSS